MASQHKARITAGVNILSQITYKTHKEEHVKTINDTIKQVTKYPNKGLKYKRIDLDSLQLTVFSDGTFSEYEDESSKAGYIIFLTDKNNNANPIDYVRIKSRRVVRSVLGAETFALADACDNAILIQHDLQGSLNKKVKIKILTDSTTLFNLMIRNASTTEKRLMIDIKATTEAYNNDNIDSMIWIRRKFNLVDAMAKSEINNDLVQAMDNRTIHFEIETR